MNTYSVNSDSTNTENDSEWTPSQCTTVSEVDTQDELDDCEPAIKHETWKVINGFSDYLVSDMGNLKHRWLLHDVTQKTDKNGYLYVVLIDDYGKSQHEWIHRIVAKSFCLHTKHSPLHYTVDHISRIKTDNRSENLRYATPTMQANNRCNSKNRIESHEEL